MRRMWCFASSICAWLSRYDLVSAASVATIFASPGPATVCALAVDWSSRRGKTTWISTNW